MNIGILYVTRTSNTKTLAYELAKLLEKEKHTCTVMGHYEDQAKSLESHLDEYDALLFGAWTHGIFVIGQHPPKAYRDYIKQMASLKHKPILTFCSFAIIPGSMGYFMRKSVESKQGSFMRHFSFRGAKPNKAFSQYIQSLDSIVQEKTKPTEDHS